MMFRPFVKISTVLKEAVTGSSWKIFKDFGPVDTAKDIRCACGPVIGPGKSKFMHEAAFDWMASKLESWQLDVER